MSNPDSQVYAIPARYRRLENMHIVFWLFKDLSWCLIWKFMGILMVAPTLSVAIFITWRTRHLKAELAHNLAVIFWIAANSYWMIAEFYEFDEYRIWGSLEGKHLAVVPFIMGILFLVYYYVVDRPREIRKNKPVTL